MILRYIIPLLALVGLISAVMFTQTHGTVQVPEPNQLSTPPQTPYEDTVSGLGITEASSRNIAVGSHLSGVVDEVMVREGDVAEMGAPLFRLDDRQAKASVEVLAKEVQAAAASIEVAKSALADANDQLARIEKLKAGKTISVDRLQRQRFAVKGARAALNQSIAVHESVVAQHAQAKITLDQHTVVAPIRGRILKSNVNVGEFIMAGQTNVAPILIGADRPMHLRVSIDENDVWRFTGKADARASLRSNKDISFPLEFVRVEPYVQPKRNLNGDMSERVDTRVLEVIYAFDPDDKPVYIGQQMDVFIEGK